MALRMDPLGTLDLSGIPAKDLSDLTIKQTAKDPGQPPPASAKAPLFPEPPSYGDLSGLAEAQPVDPYLYAALESLLGGLSSGPGRICELFRVIDRQRVVVRLFYPIRPPADDEEPRPPQPLYFRLLRGQATVAKQNKWVGEGAAEWIALLATAYYSYIGDRKTFYARKDLGGPNNAAWLMLFGKDSSLAPPKEGQEKEKKSKTSPRLAADRTAVVGKLLGAPEGDVDLDFCANQIFSEDKSNRSLSKQWQKWVSQIKIHPQTKLRGSLTIDGSSKHQELRKWLEKERSGLSPEIISRILLIFEANGLVAGDASQRYTKPQLALWTRLRKALDQRLTIALERKEESPLLARLAPGGSCCLELVDLKLLPLPAVPKKEQRALRYVVLRTAKADKERSRKYTWEERNGMQVLSAGAHSRPLYWLELDEVFRHGVRVLGGYCAKQALAAEEETTDKDFEFSLSEAKR